MTPLKSQRERTFRTMSEMIPLDTNATTSATTTVDRDAHTNPDHTIVNTTDKTVEIASGQADPSVGEYTSESIQVLDGLEHVT